MPWLLDETAGSHDLDWVFPDRAALPRSFASPRTVPPEDTWPIRIILNSNATTLPDFGRGPLGGTVVVSQRFRDLANRLEPHPHQFIPLRIEPTNGALALAEYSLFKPGSWIENGFVLDASNIEERTAAGTVTYLIARHPPWIVWRREAVQGRNIWTDARLLNATTVSDDFYLEMKAANMTGFQAIECRLEGSE